MLQVGQQIKGTISAIGTSEAGQNGVTYYNIKVNENGTIHTVRMGAKKALQVGQPVELVVDSTPQGKLPYCKKPPKDGFGNGGFGGGNGNSDPNRNSIEWQTACKAAAICFQGTGSPVGDVIAMAQAFKELIEGKAPASQPQGESWEDPAQAEDPVPDF